MMNRMQRYLLLIAICGFCAGTARAEKIQSLATIFGAESVHIEGHGLVTGLKGTGDKGAAAIKLMKAYLEKNQLTLDVSDLSSKNMALVKVDAEVPPFIRPGQKIDIRITAMNDAQSLEGGVLMQCALKARPDGDIWAFASGRVLIGADGVHPTTGVIPANGLGGAQILKVVPTRVVEDDNKFRLNLNRKSFADAAAIAQAINTSDTINPYRTQQFGFGGNEGGRKIAWAIDAGQVIVQIPAGKRNQKVEFIAEVLDLPVPVARPARVLFNRQSRTVILTGDVRVDPVSVSHDDLFVTLSPLPNTPPGVTSPQRQYTLEDGTQRRLVELDGHRRSMPNLEDMIDTLNAMGARPEDMIAILQKMKAAGALHAELIVE